jgi:hypothetical protein
MDNNERELCLKYQELVNSIWGKGFRYDMRQEHLASKLLALGYTVDSFIADATKLSHWRHDRRKPAIASLQYFVTRKERLGQPIDVDGLIKKIVAHSRFR